MRALSRGKYPYVAFADFFRVLHWHASCRPPDGSQLLLDSFRHGRCTVRRCHTRASVLHWSGKTQNRLFLFHKIQKCVVIFHMHFYFYLCNTSFPFYVVMTGEALPHQLLVAARHCLLPTWGRRKNNSTSSALQRCGYPNSAFNKSKGKRTHQEEIHQKHREVLTPYG